MNATQFVKSFKLKFAEMQPDGYGRDWTEGVYPIIEQIGVDAKFTVRHNKLNKEINHLDFAYIPTKSDLAYPPAVVIEHENLYDVDETWKDFWKLCLYAVPLRVMIGYKEKEGDAFQAGQALIERYKTWNLRQLPSGETLLIIGWGEWGDDDGWLFWLRRGEEEWLRQGEEENWEDFQ